MMEDEMYACVGRCDRALTDCVNRGPASEVEKCERIFRECENECDHSKGGHHGLDYY